VTVTKSATLHLSASLHYRVKVENKMLSISTASITKCYYDSVCGILKLTVKMYLLIYYTLFSLYYIVFTPFCVNNNKRILPIFLDTIWRLAKEIKR